MVIFLGSLALLCYSIGCNEHGGLRWQPHTSGRSEYSVGDC